MSVELNVKMNVELSVELGLFPRRDDIDEALLRGSCAESDKGSALYR